MQARPWRLPVLCKLVPLLIYSAFHSRVPYQCCAHYPWHTQIKFLREGGEDAELFEQLLLDEPDGHDGGSSSSSAGGGSGGGAGPGGQQGGGGGFGLVQFVEHVQQEAALQLQQESAQGQGQGGR